MDRQELYDELKRLASTGESFTPVDIALAIGAGEPQVSKALLGLAAEGYLEKAEVGKYRATSIGDLSQAEFLKAFARASKVDSTRQRDLSEIGRLKANNDTMRQRLLTAVAERDHYLAVLKKHGIDPGPAPVPVVPGVPAAGAAAPEAAPPAVESPPPAPPASAPASTASTFSNPPPTLVLPSTSAPAPGPAGLSVPSPESESAPSGPGDDHSHDASSTGPEHG